MQRDRVAGIGLVLVDVEEGIAGKLFRRLRGIAISHVLLFRGNWSGATLQDLVEAHLPPFGAIDVAYVRVAGPVVAVRSETAQTLGLALDELATNSAKYGVLGGSAGQLNTDWKLETENGHERQRAAWLETSTVPFEIGESRDFGSQLSPPKISPTFRGPRRGLHLRLRQAAPGRRMHSSHSCEIERSVSA